MSIEKIVKMMFEYYRQYRTYYQIGDSYNVSESCAYRTIKYVEEVLIKSGEYALDGKKGLLREGAEVEVAVMMLQSIQRLQKQQKWQAKRKRDIQ
ncbi:hypothetical protein AGMMS49593_07220 [Endomicrobiia bacterium]|nr:hypothetical protein AGMMS49593_07220 [Endomicrobiia bacterium]